MPLSKESRKFKIIKLLSDHETLTITSIAKLLEVSEMTVRRYLKVLEDDEIFLGINNGYMLMDNLTTELPFFKKQLVKVDEKKEIAIKALSFIKPNDHIFLDAGTTTFELAKLLKDVNFPLTIATNDIKSSSILVDSYHTVISTGGIIQNNVGSMYGVHTIKYLEESKFDVSFVATEAVFDASISAPILGNLDIIPVLAAQAAAFGAMIFSYFNDSLFWVVNRMMGIKKVKEQVLVWTVPTTIGWAVSGITLVILSLFI